MTTPFQIGENSTKLKKKRSQKQEKRWANKVKGKPQPASGALWGARGDVKEQGQFLSKHLWENKYTTNKSYSLTLDVWNDIKEKALRKQGGYIPGMHIEFKDPSGKTILRLVVLEEDDYLDSKE
jgi:hypothetical protein